MFFIQRAAPGESDRVTGNESDNVQRENKCLSFLAENCQRTDCMLSDFSNVFQVRLAEHQQSFRIMRVIRRKLRCDARDARPRLQSDTIHLACG